MLIIVLVQMVWKGKMEERLKRANEEEKERCVLKKKTPLTVVSGSFVDSVRGDTFGDPVPRK